MIDSATVIQTDPVISRNGTTDYGKLYRGGEEDGPPAAYFFTAQSAFDVASGFENEFGPSADRPIATFKFSQLQLVDDPTISTENGGAVHLALISVANLTSALDIGGSGHPLLSVNILTFAGIQHLLLAAQNGSILLGSDIAFSDVANLTEIIFHARGTNSAITIDSDIGVARLRLNAQGSTRLGGKIAVDEFESYSGVDFLTGRGTIRTGSVDITAGHDINFAFEQFPTGDTFGFSVDLNAGNAVNIDIDGDTGIFSRAASVHVTGDSINISGDQSSDIIFERDTQVVFTAGLGGIQAPGIFFDHFAASAQFDWTSEGDIIVGGVVGADNLIAGGNFEAELDVITAYLQTGGRVSVGGDLTGFTIRAGTTIDVGGRLFSFDASAGDDVTADTVQVLLLKAPNGILTAGSGGIIPVITDEGAAAEHIFNVSTVVSPSGIDFSGNQFGGANDLFSGGLLTINADFIAFDAETGVGPVDFNGADGFGSTSSPDDGRGGDGGRFTVNTTGNISVSEDIFATTGRNESDPEGILFGGSGGKVKMDSSNGVIAVDSTIQVSSNEAEPDQSPPPPPLRRSASGGDIFLHSGRASGTAINLTEDSHLLSLLNGEAPGPGGTISVTTDGGNIAADGEIIADRGTIIISSAFNIPRGGPVPNGLPPAPLISFGDFAFLRAETLLISSAGDVQFGLEDTVALQAVTISLAAERNINGTTFASEDDGPVLVQNSSGNVEIDAGGSISLDNILVSRRSAGVKEGLNLRVDAGMDLNITHNVFLEVVVYGMTLGGNITVHSTRNTSIGGTLSAQVSVRSDSTEVGNITLSSGGSFAANEFDLRTFVGDGVQLQSGANINVDVTGDLGVTGTESAFSAVVDNADGHIVKGGNISVHSGGSILDGISYNFLVRNHALDTIDTGGNITIDADKSFETSEGGDITLRIDNRNGHIGTGGNITVTIGEELHSGTLTASIDNRNGGEITTSGGNINFTITGAFTTDGSAKFVVDEDPLSFRLTISGGISPTRITLNAGSISAGARFDAYVDDTDFGSFAPFGSGLAHVHSNSTIAVTGVLNVLGFVSADGAISAGTLSSTNVSTPAALTVGAGGIRRFSIDGGPFTFAQHTLSALSITSQGGVNFNGKDATATTDATSGGFLSLTANSLTFGPGGIAGSVTLNGGNSGSLNVPIGNGGFLFVETSGPLTVNAPIEATTGSVPESSVARGNGGTVSLQSTTDTVNINSRIEVSSADPFQSPTPSPVPRRRSARGGNISITSGKSGTAAATTRAVAVNVTSSSQLLSLLAAAPTPRPGGKVTILATGVHSDVNVNGKVQADGGTIDIRHQGTGGHVNIGGPNTVGGVNTIANNLAADVIKAGAFGADGQLNIGRSNLSADTLLQLYAPGSNGQVNFIANAFLSGNSSKYIAGDSVSISNGVTVTIGGPAANIYVNSTRGIPNANYTNWGGNGTTTGTFARPAGDNSAPANTPQPLGNAPAFSGTAPQPAGR